MTLTKVVLLATAVNQITAEWTSDNTKIPCSTPVTYKAVFMSTFTEHTHPSDQKSLGPDFVSSILGTVDNPDLIPLQKNFLQSAHLYTITPNILVSHNDGYSMWKEGELASPGFACMLMNGVFGGAPCSSATDGHTVIDDVVAAVGDSVLEYSVSNHAGGQPCPQYVGLPGLPDTPCVYGPRVADKLGNPADPSSATTPPFGLDTEYDWTIKVDEQHSLVSSGAMIGPSPDWGVGVSAVNLCVDGFWAHATQPAYPIDAGSRAGNTYLSYFTQDFTSEPIKVIRTVEDTTTGDDGHKIFAYPGDQVIAPMGQYLFEPLQPCSDFPACSDAAVRKLLFISAPITDACPDYCAPQPYSWYSTKEGEEVDFNGRRK
jgi:hypothetical protein